MITRPTLEGLLKLARMVRDRLNTSATERANADTLIAAAHLEMREGQEVLLGAGYDKLELAARVVCRVAKEGDPVELVDVIANLSRVVEEQRLLRARAVK